MHIPTTTQVNLIINLDQHKLLLSHIYVLFIFIYVVAARRDVAAGISHLPTRHAILLFGMAGTFWST